MTDVLGPTFEEPGEDMEGGPSPRRSQCLWMSTRSGRGGWGLLTWPGSRGM